MVEIDPEQIRALGESSGLTAEQIQRMVEAIEKSGRSISNTNMIVSEGHRQLSLLGEASKKVSEFYRGGEAELTKYASSFKNTHILTQQQTTQLGLLATGFLGATRSFENFTKVDTSNLNTFNKQLSDVWSTLTKGGGASELAVRKINESFKQIVPPKIAEAGEFATINYLNNLAAKADNALKLQNAFIQLSAASGNLNKVFNAAGPELKNINALLSEQTRMMDSVSKATGAAPEMVEKYFSQLATIPGALEAQTFESKNAENQMNMLTGAIKVATGSGRSYESVIGDLQVAYRDYNIIGEKALDFTARIGKVSSNVGATLDSVQKSLVNTASTFKMFGDQSRASTEILNNYVGALKATGISGDLAVNIIGNMTNQIGQLTIAQKSFLSAQTGGPGGLVGAFQIEKDLREGKLDKVFDKVKTQMQKQFGKIVTLDEASMSPGAAAQLTRQIQILRQGPLGQFAKSDQEAIRILEGFRGQQTGKGAPQPLTDVLGTTIKQGTDIQAKSYTIFTEIRNDIAQIRKASDLSALGLIQEATTASTGTGLVQTAAQAEEKGRLLSGMRGGASTGALSTDQYARVLREPSQLTDRTGTSMLEGVNSITNLTKNIPKTLVAAKDAFSKAFGDTNYVTMQNEIERLSADINRHKQELEKLPQDKRKAASRMLDEEMKMQKAMVKTYEDETGDISFSQQANITKPKFTTRSTFNQLYEGTAGAPENRLEAAAAGATRVLAVRPTAGGTTTVGPSQNNLNIKLEPVDVQVTGYCLECQQRIKNSAYKKSINAASES